MKIKYFSFSMLLLSLTACQTVDYYRSRAVDKARTYVMKEGRDLDEIQRSYIRYAPPYIMNHRLFDYEGKETLSRHDITQTCIVWDIPESKEAVAVVGVSERSLKDWYPIRIVKKTFEKANKAEEEAIHKARVFELNKMLYLSDHIRNRIRFNPPLILKTNFELEEKKWFKELKAPSQTSFVWNSDKKGEKIVITGMGEENLTSWKAIKGWEKTSDELGIVDDEETSTEKEKQK